MKGDNGSSWVWHEQEQGLLWARRPACRPAIREAHVDYNRFWLVPTQATTGCKLHWSVFKTPFRRVIKHSILHVPGRSQLEDPGISLTEAEAACHTCDTEWIDYILNVHISSQFVQITNEGHLEENTWSPTPVMAAVTHPSGQCALQPTRDSCVIDRNIDVIDRKLQDIFNWLIVFIDVRSRAWLKCKRSSWGWVLIFFKDSVI